MTTVTDYSLTRLHDALEKQFRHYTDQLTEWTLYSKQPDYGGYDRDTLAALITTARQGVTDTAHALQRMSQGTYGMCENCQETIPLERLEAVPYARFCISCQRLYAQ